MQSLLYPITFRVHGQDTCGATPHYQGTALHVPATQFARNTVQHDPLNTDK